MHDLILHIASLSPHLSNISYYQRLGTRTDPTEARTIGQPLALRLRSASLDTMPKPVKYWGPNTLYSNEQPVWNADTMAFLCGQKEVCPTTHREHWQFFVAMKKPHTKGQMRDIFRGAHLEESRSAAAVAYCEKIETSVSDSKFMYGDKDYAKGKGKGHRSDLDDIVDKVKAGAPLIEIAESHSKGWINHNKGIQSLRYKLMKPRDSTSLMKVIWLTGTTSVGKTTTARNTYPTAYFKADCTTKEWTDYDGEKVVILDEFSEAAIEALGITYWLGVLRNHPFKVWPMYAYVHLQAYTFVITSNLTLSNFLYRLPASVTDEHKAAFKARITEELTQYQHTNDLEDLRPDVDIIDLSNEEQMGAI